MEQSRWDILVFPSTNYQEVSNLVLHLLFAFDWITRGLTERKVEGMEDLVSLNLEEIEKPLGYGYDAGTNILFWVESN